MLWTETLGSVLFADVQLFSSAGGVREVGLHGGGDNMEYTTFTKTFYVSSIIGSFQSLNMLRYFKFSHE